MTRNKNLLFVSHFETLQHLKKMQNYDSAYLYSANFTAKFRGESGFLGGSMEPPPVGTNESESTLVTYVLITA